MSKSINIARHETPRFWITVGEWDSDVTGVSYEVGLREREAPHSFALLATYVRRKSEALRLGEMARDLARDGGATLAGIKSQMEDGEWLDRMFP